jgi:hypothetical protein
VWRDRIEGGLVKMRERDELAASADPHDPGSPHRSRHRAASFAARFRNLPQ